MSAGPTLLSPKDQWLQRAVTNGWLSEAELTAGIAKAHAQRDEVVHVLLETKKLTAEQLAQLKADAAQVPFVHVADYEVDRGVLQLVPESLARQHHVLPLYRLDNILTVATDDPWNAVAIDALRSSTRLPLIHTVVGLPEAIRAAIDRHYGLRMVEVASAPVENGAAVELSEDQAVELARKPPAEAAEEVSVITLVDALLAEALKLRASDIHFEPDAAQTRVRFRIDGILHAVKSFPIALHEALCSRIKVLAKLDITERRVPQDGHVLTASDGRSIDLRVSTYPTIHGENIVIRLLDQAAVALRLPELGFAPETVAQFERLMRRPNGLLLVTGPTGAGKTTTLYALLNQINDIGKNIVTIEDPVEYQLPLVRQTQVNLKAGVTFASGLRAVLRQDPDVVMVGEVRDEETAETAVHAALTGHLVLSTLHTNDAIGAVGRLLAMGVEPYLLSSTLLGVCAQRLVRRLCPECVEGARAPAALRAHHPELTATHRGRGCRRCRQTGFAGRLGIGELLVVDETIRLQIATGGSAEAVRAASQRAGMRTMRSDGLRKVQEGLTTLEELDRVVPPDAAG